MSSLLARGQITLTELNETHFLSFSPSSLIIPTDYDGGNPNLQAACSNLSLLLGCNNVKFEIAAIQVSLSGVSVKPELQSDMTYNIYITQVPPKVSSFTVQVIAAYNDNKGIKRGAKATLQVSTVTSIEGIEWLKEWDGTSTVIDQNYVITPKIFAGHKETDPNTNQTLLTGVYIGRRRGFLEQTLPYAFVNEDEGLYGYQKNKLVFYITNTGAKIAGWIINPDQITTTNAQGTVSIASSGVLKYTDTKKAEVWKIDSDGSAMFGRGNVKIQANGDAYFNGKIITKQGSVVAGWHITEGSLSSKNIRIDSQNKYIGIIGGAEVDASNMTSDACVNKIKSSGGILIHHTSSGNYGIVGYIGNNIQIPSFQLGSVNKIGAFSFDSYALWTGTKNDTLNAYTTNGITLGTNGLRGTSWYINSNGSVSFAKGIVTFDAQTCRIAGWTVNSNQITNGGFALSSEPSQTGWYISALNLGAGVVDYANIINNGGGIYAKRLSVGAEFVGVSNARQVVFKLTTTSSEYNRIAGWNFDATAIWTGDKPATSSSFTSSGITMHSTLGIFGKKWRLLQDGSGSLAGGNIVWDINGKVTLSPNVTLQWSNISGAIGNNLTKINGDCIYTGVITAGQLSAGTITTCSIKQEAGLWYLNQDGSGWLANKNISWNAKGDVVFSSKVKVMWQGGIDAANIIATGMQLHRDTEFSKGQNGLSGYAMGDGTTIKIITLDTAPNRTKKILRLTTSRWCNIKDHRVGGVLTADQSKAGGIFVCRILARFPKFLQINNYHNAYGKDATTEWLTSQVGTGHFTEYICVVKCGYEGDFSTINHFAFTLSPGYERVDLGPTDTTLCIREKATGTQIRPTVEFDIAYFNVFDGTASEGFSTTITKDGVYTGTLKAEQITAGKIGVGFLDVNNILRNTNGMWQINPDGSGWLANKNFTWDSKGNATFKGNLNGVSGSFEVLTYIDEQGKRAGTIGRQLGYEHSLSFTGNCNFFDGVNIRKTLYAPSTYVQGDMSVERWVTAKVVSNGASINGCAMEVYGSQSDTYYFWEQIHIHEYDHNRYMIIPHPIMSGQEPGFINRGDYAGISIDTIVFTAANTDHPYDFALQMFQKITVINMSGITISYCINGHVKTLATGGMMRLQRVPVDWLGQSIAANAPGAGLIRV